MVLRDNPQGRSTFDTFVHILQSCYSPIANDKTVWVGAKESGAHNTADHIVVQFDYTLSMYIS
jgi:hypothetical protein